MVGPLIFVGLLLVALVWTLWTSWCIGHPEVESCPGDKS